MNKKIFMMILAGSLVFGCKNHQEDHQLIPGTAQDEVIKKLVANGEQETDRIKKGVQQVAALWQDSDGTTEDFKTFCCDNFIKDSIERKAVFDRLCLYFESIYGLNNKMMVNLLIPTHVAGYESFPIDQLFGAWSPFAHLDEDFFNNKIAFYVMLNFPFYTLEEKNEQGKTWNGDQWGYARMGDLFISRIPANLQQKEAEATNAAENYIANYNIYMGNLVDEKGQTFFPKEMKLISHWGLRDELKSQYADKVNGLQKQKMIYEVMKHIVYQDIPKEVINKNDFQWNPYTNELYSNGKKQAQTPEQAERYAHLLSCFLSMQAIDPYTPMYPTFINRKFNQEFEIDQQEVEALFVELMACEEVKKVGALIRERLGRDLQPFDIWYDGFKSRSNIAPELLDKAAQKKYPDRATFVADLPIIMQKLGYSAQIADFVCDNVTVDGSVGAGHAWEAATKEDKARLRTRIGENGIDYKGYNIGIHEFGHNVEQTISLHKVPNYMMRGVPNTAFTEALAFVFQKRDLELLNIPNKDPLADYLSTLDIFWGCYEIMGVSLVDMRVWKWLYQHPKATEEELKEQVVAISKDVWNEYFAPVFGSKDEPILGVYSHMITSPLYLSAYPIGHLIEFQLEEYFKGKIIGEESVKLFSNGRLTPEHWLQKGMNSQLSVKPILKATNEAIAAIQKKQ